jgi:hypothetical protein
MDFRKWVTISSEHCDLVNWRDPTMITNNERVARRSIDGTEVLISYNEIMPVSLQSVPSVSEPLSRSEVDALLADAAWYVEEEI